MVNNPSIQSRYGWSFPVDITRSCPTCGDCWTSSLADEANQCPHCESTETPLDHIRLKRPHHQEDDHTSLLVETSWYETYSWLVRVFIDNGWEIIYDTHDELVLSPSNEELRIEDITLWFGGSNNHLQRHKTYLGAIIEIDGEKVVKRCITSDSSPDRPTSPAYPGTPKQSASSMEDLTAESMALWDGLMWVRSLRQLCNQLPIQECTITASGNILALEDAVTGVIELSNEEVKGIVTDVNSLREELDVDTEQVDFDSNPVYDLIYQ